jgi:hypothetical protein
MANSVKYAQNPRKKIVKKSDTTSTRFVPLSIRANRAKFGFYTIQKLFKEFSVQKTSFYTIIGNLQCKNRDCPAGIGNFGRSAGAVYHFSATSLKILFARIDRGSDRVVGIVSLTDCIKRVPVEVEDVSRTQAAAPRSVGLLVARVRGHHATPMPHGLA